MSPLQIAGAGQPNGLGCDYRRLPDRPQDQSFRNVPENQAAHGSE